MKLNSKIKRNKGTAKNSQHYLPARKHNQALENPLQK